GGEPFTLLESMQALTLRVILRAVFGYAPGADEDELARRLRAMVEPLSRAPGAPLLHAGTRGGSRARVPPVVGGRKPCAAPTARSATSCSPCGSPDTRRRPPGWPGPSTWSCMTPACARELARET